MVRAPRIRTGGGFTLVELLVVVAVLGVLAIVAIPVLNRPICVNGTIKEPQANIMNIAAELERYHADGHASYSFDGRPSGCPGLATYTSNGTAVGALPLAIQGDYYAYIVEAIDQDLDGSCECYRLTAVGRMEPATDPENGPISIDCTGAKSGPWR